MGYTIVMDLQTFIVNFASFLNIVVQFLLGLAFALFVINAIRFFVFQGSNEDGRDKAKNLAIYGVAAFVIIVIFWGIINLLAGSIDMDNNLKPCPDYFRAGDTGGNRPDSVISGDCATGVAT